MTRRSSVGPIHQPDRGAVALAMNDVLPKTYAKPHVRRISSTSVAYTPADKHDGCCKPLPYLITSVRLVGQTQHI